MGIKISSEDVTYSVNNFPTTMEAEGDKKSGFIYTVSWVDSTYSKDLECAKMQFDTNELNNMLKLANKVSSL